MCQNSIVFKILMPMPLLLGVIGMIFKMNDFNNLFVFGLMLQIFQFGKEKEMDIFFWDQKWP